MGIGYMRKKSKMPGLFICSQANQKLDELAAATTTSPEDKQAAAAQPRCNLSKAEINSLTYDALSKGQVLLDSLGWDSPRTKVYEFLLA